jgi:choline-glycine betaine transporter
MAWGRTAPNDESPRSFLIAVGFLFAKGIGIYLIFFGVGLLAFEAH